MADRSNKLPVLSEKSPPGVPREWRPLERLWSEIDRLFEDFGGGFFRGSSFDGDRVRGGQSLFPAMPAIDISETNEAYEITAELPGMNEKSIEVKIADGMLTISAEKQSEKHEENKGYFVHERSFGSFQRSFAVPADADADKIEAAFKNGVLSIKLPKSANADMLPRRIPGKSFNV
jgi:HSP20 family protein